MPTVSRANPSPALRAAAPLRRLAAAALAAFAIASALHAGPERPSGERLRPPAVPLVCHDPYFSIWSAADRLTDAWPTHWTGRPHAMQCMIRVTRPGAAPATYRLLGVKPEAVPALPQTSLQVTATTTTCGFRGNGLEVTLSFCSPLLPNDLELLSRPATYVTWTVATTDGGRADVDVHFDLVGEVAVDSPAQEVTWSLEDWKDAGLVAGRIGSQSQAVLARKGDDLRIDWGWAYLAAPAAAGTTLVAAPADLARSAFAGGSDAPLLQGTGPRRADDGWPALVLTASLPGVTAEGATTWAIVAYDDLVSIQYFDARLRPFWRRHGKDARGMIMDAASERRRVLALAGAFDASLQADLEARGGARYAELAVLAWRQAICANKLVADANGKPLLFPKENFSNGCIGTVDVIYPMSPLFLAMGPDLTRAMLIPVLDYGGSPRWTFPFAPHDLGTYPQATGQVYGGGEKTAENQMPVEESANLILLVAAASRADGSTDLMERAWPALSRWAAYLREKGYDPENQLCTDDFTGHLAHNVNLSAKAILALGAYAWMLEARRDPAAREWRAEAERMAARWVKEAADAPAAPGAPDAAATPPTRLAFDKPGTWSQKYNLVWDDILELGLFPAAVKAREVAWYRRAQQPFGLPLDSRADFTKTDWTHWSATLSGRREDFEALVEPLWRNADETPDRVPLCDWVKTREPRKVNMIARPVVGGYFLPLLQDPATWARWRKFGSREAGPASGWAPLPLAAPAP